MPYGSFHEPSPITTINPHDDVTHVPLMSVLTHSEVMTKFKCVVRVVGAMSCQAKKLCSPTRIY